MTNPCDPQPTQPPLAIVGLSALFPRAASVEQFWSNIRRGVDAITEVPDTHWNPDDYFHPDQKSPDMTYARRGGFLSPVPFDPLEFGISPNNLEAIDTSQLLGLVGAKRALEHAGYGAGRQFDRSRVGCILGVTGTLELVIPLGARLGHPRWRKALRDAGVPDDVADDVVQRISDSYVPWQENSFPGLLGNVVAGRIANRLDLHGTNCVVDAACASSLSALHLAALELWTGRSDMVVTGGIDTFNDIFMFMCFSKTPALSPTGDAKPFSETADGTILGEGVGIVVLKRLADAERDGDRIYAVLKGIGTSSDGAGNAVYAPKAEGQIRCLRDAYAVAGVAPDTIELVEAHGTGTKVGDATEVSGLLQVYQASSRPRPWCAIGSIKSQIGHTKAAAGVAGVLKAILALQHRVLPPTIKVTRPPSGLLAADSPFYVNPEARPWLKPAGHPRRAAVSAFGFGGSNFHCVLEESPQPIADVDWDGEVQIVALSAADNPQLLQALQDWSEPRDWDAVRRAAHAARKAFRPSDPCRLVFVLERDRTDVPRLIAGAASMLQKYADRAAWTTPEGACYGRGPAVGRLGVLFPGQGSQYPGMLRELACRFPVMNEVLTEANGVFAARQESAADARRLSDFIYPFPAWTPADRERSETDLRATQVAQPAIGAVSLGALAVLEQFGFLPQAAAGHSYGELTALCASQRFAPKMLYRLSMLRGRLMAEAQQAEGGMLAVGAPLSQVEAAIREMAVDLVVANHNSPSQVVLSGRIPEIDRATQLFSQRNLRGKKLPVAAAFHSPLVATASRAFRPELEDVEFAASRMPVYANSTATEYPADPGAARDLLASQLARPVNFVQEIEQMYADGIRTFVEAGPGGVLTGLVNSILSGREFRAIALDSSNGRRGGMFDLAHALAQLSASGYVLRLANWDPEGAAPEPNVSRMRVPISGANYVKPRTSTPPRPALSFRRAETAIEETPLEMTTPSAGPLDSSAATIPTVPAATTPIYAAAPFSVPPPPMTVVPRASASPTFPGNGAESGPRQPVAPGPELHALQAQLATLQKMQEETARLHQQFLESQEAALRVFEDLARRHLELSHGRPAVAVAPTATPAPVIAPTVEPVAIAPAQVTPELPRTDFRTPAPTPVPAPAVVAPPVVRPEVVAVAPASVAPSPVAFTPVASAPVPARAEVNVLPAVAPAPEPQAAVISPLAQTVLSVVSEKTGYPGEMLSLDMSLDHDLGIDSIKRVEILSSLQERVANLPAFQPDELGALQTLRDVVTLAAARVTPAPAATAEPARAAAPSVAIPVPAPIPVPAAAPVPTSAPSPLLESVLTVVAEKTGYPVEMLSPGMSLDHDLGIDSIKRVEILSALQERVPGLPAFQPDELGSLQTLEDVASLATRRYANAAPAPTACQRSAEPAAPACQVPSACPTPVTPTAPASSSDIAPSNTLAPIVLAVVAEKTGYPTEMLTLEMSLDHDLGIDSIKRVEILSALQERVPGLPAFQPDELGSLQTLRDVVQLAASRNPGAAAAPGSPPPAAVTVDSTTLAPAAATPSLAPAPSSVAATPTAQSALDLAPIVLQVVAEKTGYPAEMLTLAMSLDHDLGIDSIKRVEILSALQERVPGLPAFQPDELGSLQTLQDVVTLAASRGVTAPPATLPEARMSPATSNPAPAVLPPMTPGSSELRSPAASDRLRSPAAAGASPTILPPAAVVRSVVRMDSVVPGSELPLVRGAEIWITEDGLELSLRIASELSARGFKPRVVNLDDPVAVSFPEKMAGLIVVAPSDGTHDRQLWRAVEWLQKAGPALRRTATQGTCVFATVSRLDGRFGFEARQSLLDPLSGGLAGLTKSVAREWPELTCKAFDLSADWPSATDAAARIVDELFRQGPVEMGLTPRGRWTPVVVEDSLAGMAATAPLAPGDLVLVSGGARGVTAAATLAIARAWRPRLAILGRSPLPQEEPDWLRGLSTEQEIKQALIERMPRGTLPRAVENQLRDLLATREVRTNLQQLQELGIPVTYHAADLRDLSTVRPLLLQLQDQFGPVRGILHGAGVLADQRIEDKTREQFDKVYQTKVAGLRNLLGAIAPDQLQCLCVFSSYTARYGRIGQCDYAIANEVLNKVSRQFALEHPRTRVVSFNWGPWDGGMVTGGLKKLFAAEHVGLIPLDAGADTVVQELSQALHRPIEVLVLGRTADETPAAPADTAPAPVTPPSLPRDGSSNILLTGAASSGAATKSPSVPGSSNVLLSVPGPVPARDTRPGREPVPARLPGSSNVLLSGLSEPQKAPAPPPVPGPSGSWVFAEIGSTTTAEMAEMKLALERSLAVRHSPYLESHVIGGKAVLPMAMILEWLAHGAIHHNPGLELEGLEDFRVFHGVRLDRDESVPLRVMVGKATRIDGRFSMRAQLVGQTGDREVVYASARLILAAQWEPAPDAALQVDLQGYSLDMATTYATRLFHGTHLQGIAAVEACSAEGIIVDSRTSPAPWAWMREPLRSAWIADPLSIDAALQAVILWTQERRGMPCLPSYIASYRQYRKTFPHTGVKIVVRIVQATEHTIRADIEFLDLQGLVVARISGCESVADASLAAAFRRNRLESPAN